MSKIKVNELDTRSGTTITVAAGKTLAGTDIIGSTQIAANAVDTSEIAANAVTLVELQDGTQGDILYYGAAGAPTRLAAGTSGQFLQTQGSGQNPVYGSVTEYNDAAVLNDIATLALHSATQNNQTAFNLTNAFVDQYEDSTGIDTLSTVARDTTGEFMWCATAGYDEFTNDVNTMFLAHMDGANNGTTFTDSSSGGHTTTAYGAAVTVTGVKKIGTASCSLPSAGAYLIADGTTDFQNTTDATLECWIKNDNLTHSAVMDFRHASNTGNFYWDWAYQGNSRMAIIIDGTTREFVCTNMDDGNWHHYAVVRDLNSPGTNRWYFYFDGVNIEPVSGTMSFKMATNLDTNSRDLTLFTNYPLNATLAPPSYVDEFRYSNMVRYPNGTTFTPNYSEVAGASGNYTSTTEAAIGTVSKMGIVVLYKNESGTATLDTDLVAEVSANGGTNWTAAPLTAGGTFSTGILIAKSNDITITNTGTAPKFRISFANQSAGVKETRVYGVSLQY